MKIWFFNEVFIVEERSMTIFSGGPFVSLNIRDFPGLSIYLIEGTSYEKLGHSKGS